MLVFWIVKLSDSEAEIIISRIVIDKGEKKEEEMKEIMGTWYLQEKYGFWTVSFPDMIQDFIIFSLSNFV